MLVIPPKTGAAAAAQMMGPAAVPHQERAVDAADARSREEAWETDGGAGRASSRPGRKGPAAVRPPIAAPTGETKDRGEGEGDPMACHGDPATGPRRSG